MSKIKDETIDEATNSIAVEINTMKIMIYSLYKSLTGDEKCRELSRWEKECRRLAEKHIKESFNKKGKTK